MLKHMRCFSLMVFLFAQSYNFFLYLIIKNINLPSKNGCDNIYYIKSILIR